MGSGNANYALDEFNRASEISHNGKTLDRGTTVPTDGASGYAPGCLFVKLNGSSGACLYINNGSASSADFDAVVDLASTQTISGTKTHTLANITTLQLGGTAVDATADELNRATDASSKVVTLSTTPIAITEAAHNNRTMFITKTDGIAITLPTPAVGLEFTFIVAATIASASTIKSAAGTHLMVGYAIMSNDSDNSVVRWPALAASTYDTIDLLGTSNSTGGIEGQIIKIRGMSTTRWHVEIIGDAAGTEATPFQDTVA